MLKAAKILTQVGLGFSIATTVLLAIATIFCGISVDVLANAIKADMVNSGAEIPEYFISFLPTLYMVTMGIAVLISGFGIVASLMLIKKISSGVSKEKLIVSYQLVN